MNLVRFALPILVLAAYCFSIPASNATFPLEQPDGTVIQVKIVAVNPLAVGALWRMGITFAPAIPIA